MILCDAAWQPRHPYALLNKTASTLKQDSSPDARFPAAIGKPARRALEAAGFNNLRQLERVREADLLNLHGMGPKAMRVLREALSERGASFLDSSATQKPT